MRNLWIRAIGMFLCFSSSFILASCNRGMSLEERMKANKAILSSTQRAAEEATYKSDRFEELSSEYEALGKKIRNVPIDSTEYDQLIQQRTQLALQNVREFPDMAQYVTYKGD